MVKDIQIIKSLGMPKMSFILDNAKPVKHTNEKERKLLELINEKWPTSALELAEHLGEDISTREKQKNASSRYSYYLKKLIEKQLIVGKRIGNALIVWPIEAEKLKVIKSILIE